MTDIMILGDTHGDTNEYLHALERANETNIKHIFQVGDCGFFPSFSDVHDHLDTVQRVSAESNVTNYWVRGNHDDPDAWQNTIDDYPARSGFGYLRKNILLAPRVGYFKRFGLNFLAVGGAVSIDREWRIMEEFRRKQPKTLWWPNESVSDDDMELVNGKHVDVLLTHDCSDHTQFHTRLKPDIDSKINRQKIDSVLLRATPDIHFHGHMHTEYEWDNHISSHGQHSTKTYGLECNQNAMHDYYAAPNNWIIFNTETRTATWRKDDN